ncbi:MAG TPA: hypothetical protein VLC08_04965, partial [Chitinolyticbacter sp.]|nr:hypothetical protein [Chitinolyticbacter sp.]
QALLLGTGELGSWLALMRAVEGEDLAEVADWLAGNALLSLDTLNHMHVEALHWSTSIGRGSKLH